MADESFDAKPVDTPRAARKGRPVLRGCAMVVALLVLVFAIASWRASSALDGRVTKLKEDLAAIRAQPKERPVLVGAAVDGNSVDHLRAAEWIIADTDNARQAHPNMVTPAMERGHPSAHSTDLTKLLGDAREGLRRGEALPAPVVELTKTYAPVLQHVRDGLKRGRCDWDLKFEDGVALELPSLLAIRQVALLMAFTAELETDPRAAARAGLEIVAYGEDVARQRTLIGVMIGIAVKAIGLESLERTMRRGALPREGYEEVIAALPKVGPTDMARGLEAERLGMQVELAKLSGRPLAEGKGPAVDFPGGVYLLMAIGPLFFENEWSGYFGFFTRFEQLMTLPKAEREPKIAALMTELESSWTLFARIAMPNLSGVRDHADESLAVVDAVRVLAAAHLHRLETGSFPADAQPLAARLGGALPVDPFRADGGPLSYAVKDGAVRVWSVGEDGKDDAGDGRWFDKEDARKDLVVTGGTPPN